MMIPCKWTEQQDPTDSRVFTKRGRIVAFHVSPNGDREQVIIAAQSSGELRCLELDQVRVNMRYVERLK